MPPKKKEVAEKKVLLGRPTNNVRMGIVGLPNVGKSTFFNALSKLNVPAENFPFCTIEPNEARVPVSDERFDHLVEKYKPKSVIPAVLGITDIAGLVKGASEGAGLGNEFLSHIAAVDGIYHVCRDFANKEVTHVEGNVDPVRDIQIIHEELRLKDSAKIAAWVNANRRDVERNIGGKERKDLFEIGLKVQKLLDEDKKDIRNADWNTHEIEFLNTQQFLSAKPMIYLLNVSKAYYEAGRSKFYPEVKKWVEERGNGEKVVVISAEFEMSLLTMDEAARNAYLEEKKLKSMLDKVIIGGYKTLQMIHFFTSGADEVRAWSIKKGTLAPQAAGVIHTDFEKGFICADVHKFADFKELGSEAACKAAGKLRTQGRTYEFEDGDITFFKFNRTG